MLARDLYLRVLCGDSGQEGGRRVQPEGLVDDGSSVGEMGEGVIAWPALEVVDLLQQALLAGGVSTQQVDAEGQGVGCRLVPRQDHGVRLSCYLPAPAIKDTISVAALYIHKCK